MIGRLNHVAIAVPDLAQAAERLSTKVTRRDSAPFTTDPIGDARGIIEYLTAKTNEKT